MWACIFSVVLYMYKHKEINVYVHTCSIEVFPPPPPPQVFPGSLLPHNYADPQNPDRLLGRSEVERRRDYIQQLHGQLGEEHSLVQLVHQCLHNTPTRRPSAEELLQQLEAMRVQIEGPYGSQLKKMDIAKVGMMKALREIESLQKQVQQLMEVGVYVFWIHTA